MRSKKYYPIRSYGASQKGQYATWIISVVTDVSRRPPVVSLGGYGGDNFDSTRA
jgi:hypothetical protein